MFGKEVPIIFFNGNFFYFNHPFPKTKKYCCFSRIAIFFWETRLVYGVNIAPNQPLISHRVTKLHCFGGLGHEVGTSISVNILWAMKPNPRHHKTSDVETVRVWKLGLDPIQNGCSDITGRMQNRMHLWQLAFWSNFVWRHCFVMWKTMQFSIPPRCCPRWSSAWPAPRWPALLFAHGKKQCVHRVCLFLELRTSGNNLA